MGGDTPSDFEYCIKRVAVGADRVDQMDDELYSDEITPDEYRAAIADGMLRNLTQLSEYEDISSYGICEDDWEILYQVMGEMAMEYGMPIDDPRTIRILHNAREAAVNDSWAADGEGERKHYMDEFIAQIDAYQGSPTVAAREGLFEKIAERLTGS
jgi:hypothetical protein